MKTYLMTRGTARQSDYAFIGEAPPVRWWDSLADWVVLEEPEVIVKRDGEEFGVLLSAIPSARRDSIGTAIRYTLVVDGPPDEPELTGRLVSGGLDDAVRRALGEALDKELDSNIVDALLGDADGRLRPELIAAVLASLPEATPAGETNDEGQSWIGPLGNKKSRAAFQRRTEWLAEADRGVAFTSHALSTVAGAEEVARRLGVPIAVLLADSNLTERKFLENLDQGTPSLKRIPTVLALAALSLSGLAIVWWILRRLG